jgi:hypothetical protein
MKSKILFGVMLASSIAGSLFISTPVQADLISPQNTGIHTVICQGARGIPDKIWGSVDSEEAQRIVTDCQRRGGLATIWYG